MKVLSVKQPWAYLLCSGIKDIENRTWKLPKEYIGQRVLIHASAKPEELSPHLFTNEQWVAISEKARRHIVDELPFTSAIIGSVRFVDCVINHPSIWAEKSKPILFDDYGFPIEYEHKTYNWVVEDPILFGSPVMGVKGKLRFWNYHGKTPLKKVYLEGSEEPCKTIPYW